MQQTRTVSNILYVDSDYYLHVMLVSLRIRCYSSRLIDVGFVLLSARKAVPRSQKPPPTTTPLFALSAHFSLA